MLEANPEVLALFEKINWKLFFWGFSGHNEEVTRQFALSFDGNIAQIGNLQLVIYEEFIMKTTKLPRTSKPWFKGSRIDKKKFKEFLLPLSKEDAHLKFSFPMKYLRNQWRAPFEVISRYISCDGRYSNVQLYRLKILMALKGLRLNIPYFLLHSLH